MKRIPSFLFGVLLLVACGDNRQQRASLTRSESDLIIENILTRRSIRKYKPDQVERGQLDTILKCAIYAPSASNKQPWEVRVVQNKKFLSQINERFLADVKSKRPEERSARTLDPNFNAIYRAPTLIVLAKDIENASSSLDAGLITQNILLSAHALGLGTCPLGSVARFINKPENADLIELLNFPDGYEIALVISLGYPDETPEVRKRYPEKIKVIE